MNKTAIDILFIHHRRADDSGRSVSSATSLV